MKNKKQPTGDIEVISENITVLNKSKDNLPFNIREYQKAKESLRMRYRYLDLRFPLMQRNLRIRSEMLMKMREFLVNLSGFVDVETPTLFKATPGVSRSSSALCNHKLKIPGGTGIYCTYTIPRPVLFPSPESPTIQTDADGRGCR